MARLLFLLFLLIMIVLTSCSSGRRIPNIHTPTHREIKRAMRYSTSEYPLPRGSIYSNTVYRTP